MTNTLAANYANSERTEKMASLYLEEAESHRREKPVMDAYPLTGDDATVVDYGRTGSAMELAMAHLRESVPNGQKRRTEAAANALALSVAQHLNWLRAKGYRV